MKCIALSQGKYALVDEEDFDFLNQRRWRYHSGGYAAAYGGGGRKNQRTVLMHRVLLNPPSGQEIDHQNGNRLDNRRSNLRLCTSQQNKANSARRSDNTSGFRGVYANKRYGKPWLAKINVGGRQIHLGAFSDKIEAAEAYARASVRYFGEFSIEYR